MRVLCHQTDTSVNTSSCVVSSALTIIDIAFQTQQSAAVNLYFMANKMNLFELTHSHLHYKLSWWVGGTINWLEYAHQFDDMMIVGDVFWLAAFDGDRGGG